jgi:hypothetical protein
MPRPQFHLRSLFIGMALFGWAIVTVPYWAYEFPIEIGLQQTADYRLFPLRLSASDRAEGLAATSITIALALIVVWVAGPSLVHWGHEKVRYLLGHRPRRPPNRPTH